MSVALRLCNLALGLALIVVMLGAWTRLNDAGLSCPDWPGCYGHWVLPTDEQGLLRAQAQYPAIPLDDTKGWLEMVHRYAASLLGLTIIVLAAWGWRAPQISRGAFGLMLLLALLVIVQGVFGMLTVTLKLVPQIVTLHLLGGLLTLGMLMVVRHVLVRPGVGVRVHQGLRYSLQLGLVLLFVQIALGGWTSANYAGWACNGWPHCSAEGRAGYNFKEGFRLPEIDGVSHEGGSKSLEARAAIQMTHRIGALVVTLYLGLICVCCMRIRWLRGAALGVIGTLLGQSLLGVANVVFGLPLWLAMAHHIGAVLLLASSLWLYMCMVKPAREVCDVGQ